MTDFKSKLHQIRFRLGLRPRPRWGAYLLAVFGGLLRGRGRVVGEEEEKGKGREGKWRGGKGRTPPKLLLNQGPSEPCYATARQSAGFDQRSATTSAVVR